jgi:hypothetical protein
MIDGTIFRNNRFGAVSRPGGVNEHTDIIRCLLLRQFVLAVLWVEIICTIITGYDKRAQRASGNIEMYSSAIADLSICWQNNLSVYKLKI